MVDWVNGGDCQFGKMEPGDCVNGAVCQDGIRPDGALFRLLRKVYEVFSHRQQKMGSRTLEFGWFPLC